MLIQRLTKWGTVTGCLTLTALAGLLLWFCIEYTEPDPLLPHAPAVQLAETQNPDLLLQTALQDYNVTRQVEVKIPKGSEERAKEHFKAAAARRGWIVLETEGGSWQPVVLPLGEVFTLYALAEAPLEWLQADGAPVFHQSEKDAKPVKLTIRWKTEYPRWAWAGFIGILIGVAVGVFSFLFAGIFACSPVREFDMFVKEE